MSFPYVVYTPPYDPRSGGIKVLHLLVHELNSRGYQAYCTSQPNPEWNEPPIDHIPKDSIVVYPEIVPGNPWGATTVARWVLNVPGRLAGDTEYDKSELVFPYKRIYNQWGLPERRILLLPAIDLDIFYDRGLERKGKIVYVGKGPVLETLPETQGLYELRKEDTANQENLAILLNRTEVLYTYDNITALWDCARLCGCATVIIPNGQMSREHFDMDETGTDGLGLGIEEEEKAVRSLDSLLFRARYSDLYTQDFPEKLEHFIYLTQARAGWNKMMREMS